MRKVKKLNFIAANLFSANFRKTTVKTLRSSVTLPFAAVAISLSQRSIEGIGSSGEISAAQSVRRMHSKLVSKSFLFAIYSHDKGVTAYKFRMAANFGIQLLGECSLSEDVPILFFLERRQFGVLGYYRRI